MHRLALYHDRVEALAAEAEALIRHEGVPGLPRVAKLRIDQGVAMAAYQLYVHRELFEPMTRSGTSAQNEAAKRLKVECVMFSGTFCRYVQDWARRDAAAEWEAYRPAALAMVAAVRAHIARVREEIAPAIVEARLRDTDPATAAA